MQGGGSGSAINWSEIGYEEEPSVIKRDFDYAKNIIETWDDSVTSLRSKFETNKQLVYMPLVDTSNVTNMEFMFTSCSNLTTVPLLDTSNVTEARSMFTNCPRLFSIPLLNIRNVTDVRLMFNSCTSLVDVPLFDISSVTNIYNMFSSCPNLSNKSLNNILAMCTSAISYTRTKTLKEIGLSETQATTCQTLSNYQAFLDAGWTTGY